MSITIKEYNNRKKKYGTMEWVLDKWTKKIFLASKYHADRGEGNLPSFLRKEFMRDLSVVVEYRIKELFPNNCVIGLEADKRRPNENSHYRRQQDEQKVR